MQSIIQDLRYSGRMLLKQPAFTLIALLTVALGLGANTAIFSVVNGVLLRGLPYPDSQQLVRLFETVEREGVASDRMEVAPANFIDWQSQSQSFSAMSAYGLTGVALSEGGEAQRLEGALVTSSFFETLGVAPLRGRAFTPEDERDQERRAIISFDLWQRSYARADDVVGRQIQLDGFAFTIVGVMPSGFDYPRRTEVFELYRLSANQRVMREARFLKVVARLKQGVTVAQAREEMTRITRRLGDQHPQTNRNWGASVVHLLDEQVGKTRPALLLLLAAVGLVLLIACANVASLLLARAVARQREIAIRLALGASRLRIARQLLTESLLLALAGGGLGLLFGVWGMDVLLKLAPTNLPRLREVGLDAGVLAFTMLASLLTGLLFGLAPAWQAASQDVQSALKREGSRTAGHRNSRRVLGGLVVAEVALAFVTLVGGGLLASSFWRLQNVDPGIDVDRLLTVEFEPPSARYNGDDWRAQRLNFWNQLSPRVAGLPGVEAVGAIDNLPFSGEGRLWRFRKAEDNPDQAAAPAAGFQVTTEDYFRAAGIESRRGRLFTRFDRDGAPRVAIINETMARRFWPDQDAVGQRIVIRNEREEREIVGVVGDVRHFGLERAADPEMYVAFEQFVIDVMPLVIRVKTDPAQLVSLVRSKVREVDPTVAIERIEPMTSLVSRTLAERRFTLVLLGVFGGIALVLASIGLYGVMSYLVRQRTQEIGIRLAIGGQQRDILRLIARHGLTLALLGTVVGLVGSLSLTRLMSTLLFGVTPTDPLTLAAIGTLLLCVAALACYIPARRAARVDPLVALRYE